MPDVLEQAVVILSAGRAAEQMRAHPRDGHVGLVARGTATST